jgi:hypothetical protein
MFLMTDNKWERLLAFVTGLVNQKLLLQNEYLAAENRILRAHLPAGMRLSDPAQSTLGEIGKRLGRPALQQVACVAMLRAARDRAIFAGPPFTKLSLAFPSCPIVPQRSSLSRVRSAAPSNGAHLTAGRSEELP